MLYKNTGAPKKSMPQCLFFFLNLVFSTGCQATPNMPLRLVFVKDLPHLMVKAFVALWKSLGKVFVYSRFGYAELPGGSPYGSFVLNDVSCQIAGALLDSVFHGNTTSPKMCKLLDDMRGAGAKDGDCHFPVHVIG